MATDATDLSAEPGSRLTLASCALAALSEGFDNQSMGVAAPRLVPEFALSTAQASIVFSAATLGLFLGAAVGGRIADRVGRRRTLAASLLFFGVFSLLTAAATDLREVFLARLFTGLGLGGALPNFIALASEATSSQRRVSAVTVILAGMPLGGCLAGLVALGEPLGYSWRMIFTVGGLLPLAGSLLIWTTRGGERVTVRPARGAADQAAPALPPATRVLFGAGRAATTCLLWAGFFFTQLVLLLMLNWLPSLMVGLGFTAAEASAMSMAFNLGGAAGSTVLGRLHASPRRRTAVAVTYGGIIVALIMLAAAPQAFWMAAAMAAMAGVFIIGAQLTLFALAPLYYEPAVHGTGVGAAVAVGRLGSVVGPLTAAVLLTGGGSGHVLLGIIPFVTVAGAAALALTSRPRPL